MLVWNRPQAAVPRSNCICLSWTGLPRARLLQTATIMNRILLIEDDAGITMALTDLLRAEGYQVATAADGLTGLAQAGAGHADAIILDVMLPGKNGFDVCRELRQRKVTTPILMLTARGQV